MPQQATSPPALQAEGAAFPLALRVMASGLMLGLLVAAGRAAQAGGWGSVSGQGWLLLAAATLVVGSGYAGIMRSRTRFDDTHVRQTWLWRKEVAFADITQLKLIRVPGLDWVFVPRLVVRARGHAMPVTFQLGNAHLVSLARRLAYGAE